jgi:hypothetical protein
LVVSGIYLIFLWLTGWGGFSAIIEMVATSCIIVI